jgi:hypothetical protein
MKSITVTAENRQPLQGGRVAFGRQNFSCRGGSYETYEVRLSAKAAALLEGGDELRWGDWGANELPYIRCRGEIIKSDGRRVQLHGSRDVGIDTGHPPHMGLVMQTRKGVTWEYDFDGQSWQVAKAPWGTWYRFHHCPPGIWGVKSHDEMIGFASECEVFDGQTQVLSNNKRLKLASLPVDQQGWISGTLTPQVKTIGDVKTDIPLILSR